MEEELIETVKKEKCLYDLKDPYYVNIKYKDSLWKRIAEELNFKDGELYLFCFSISYT